MVDASPISIAIALLSAAISSLAAAEPTQSTYLSDVRLDRDTLDKFADESDNFALTWHTDGAL